MILHPEVSISYCWWSCSDAGPPWLVVHRLLLPSVSTHNHRWSLQCSGVVFMAIATTLRSHPFNYFQDMSNSSWPRLMPKTSPLWITSHLTILELSLRQYQVPGYISDFLFFCVSQDHLSDCLSLYKRLAFNGWDEHPPAQTMTDPYGSWVQNRDHPFLTDCCHRWCIYPAI